jgi:hypothetical protein
VKRNPAVPTYAVQTNTTQAPPERVLILGCSQAKCSQEGRLPAIQRYNGPPFQVLRRYLRLHSDDQLRVFILSAEFGLIPADDPIPNYDRRMTPSRAQELQPQVADALNQALLHTGPKPSDASRMMVHLSKDYLPALFRLDRYDLELLQSRIPEGGRGPKLSALHDWLYGVTVPTPQHEAGPGKPQHFRGIEVNLNKEDVLETALRGLREESSGAASLHSWYVELGERRVAPKWLVSQVTGLPVSAFTTNEARSLLMRISIETKRV